MLGILQQAPLEKLAQDEGFMAQLLPLAFTERTDGGTHRFMGEIETRFCGRHGSLVRVMPRHPVLGAVFEQGVLAWG